MSRIVQPILLGKEICLPSLRTLGNMYFWETNWFKKRASKEIMDFDLDKVALWLCCSGLAINLSIIGYYEQQISHKIFLRGLGELCFD